MITNYYTAVKFLFKQREQIKIPKQILAHVADLDSMPESLLQVRDFCLSHFHAIK